MKFYTIFKYTLVAAIFLSSILALVHALRSETVSQLNDFVPWFAAIEAVCAILLLIPHVKKVAAILLLIIFAVSLVVHGPSDQLALFVYAAGVLVVAWNG